MNPLLQAHLEPLRLQVEVALAAYLDRETTCPPRLLDALRYSLLAPGKRLRPLLTLLACEAVGGEVKQALPAACAVEMVHTYSLVHDDLPGMDDDDLRRGQPTCHKQFDEATAILVGDGLLTLAFQILAEETPPKAVAGCVADLARGAGLAGMVGGQMDDLLAEQQPSDLATLESIHRRKTGALFRAALRLGGRLGLPPDHDAASTLAALDAFAAPLGLAFQVADDLLDVTGDEAAAGKKLYKDAARGKLTYPSLLGIPAAQRQLANATAQALAALAPFGPHGQWLWLLVEWMGQRQA